MLAPKDFVGLGVWMLVLMAYRTFGFPIEFELNKQDKVFVSLYLLVFIQLVWLRVGYPAP
jgi:predicted small integral membrane protein